MKNPEAPSQIFDHRIYKRVSSEPYVNRKGQTVELITYQGGCQVCGALITFKISARSTFVPPRLNCSEHAGERRIKRLKPHGGPIINLDRLHRRVDDRLRGTLANHRRMEQSPERDAVISRIELILEDRKCRSEGVKEPTLEELEQKKKRPGRPIHKSALENIERIQREMAARPPEYWVKIREMEENAKRIREARLRGETN